MDPVDPMAQLDDRSSMVSLDAPLTSETDGEEIMRLHDVLASRAEDPTMTATRRPDWDRLASFLDALAWEVLHQVLQQPRWRDNIKSSRERLVCRQERQSG